MIPIFAALLAAASMFTALPTLPSPAASFDSGMLHVDRYGNSGTPIVFIPGLGCGPWSWAEQITRFSKDHTVYAVTLPGFDGRPFTPQPDLISTFNADFWKMLDTQHITKPVVIGHSLGGTLGFALAESHPERLAGVIALDGLPVFPMLARSTDEQRMAAATQMAGAVAKENHDELLAYERSYMKQVGTTHDDLIEPTAQLEAKSDPKAVAAWGAADLGTDFRPQLGKANVPIVELMPYAQPSPYSKDMTLGFYQQLVKGAPNVKVIAIDDARHFAMLDQPAAVDAAITQSLASMK